jgi:hypothetical protein
MGRYKKQIFILIIILAVLAVFGLRGGEKNQIKINVKKNEIEINNFELAKVVDEQNNFYKLNADIAVLNKNDKTADLTRFSLVYKKGETDLTANADKGMLKEEVFMKASGRIHGVVNGLAFETGDEGTFDYDFTTEEGMMTGNVLVKGEEGTILSNKAIIYHKKNILEFDGNVKVNFNKD